MREAERDSDNTHSAIPLGICILFLTGLRVGELCALQYGDIKGNSLYVRRMMIEKQIETPDGQMQWNGYEIVDHTKSSAGTRMKITEEKTAGMPENMGFLAIFKRTCARGFEPEPSMPRNLEKKGVCGISFTLV